MGADKDQILSNSMLAAEVQRPAEGKVLRLNVMNVPGIPPRNLKGRIRRSRINQNYFPLCVGLLPDGANELLEMPRLVKGSYDDAGLDFHWDDCSCDASLGAVKRFERRGDRKSTRLNSSHSQISYAVFCFEKTTTSHPCHFHHTPLPAQVRAGRLA